MVIPAASMRNETLLNGTRGEKEPQVEKSERCVIHRSCRYL